MLDNVLPEYIAFYGEEFVRKNILEFIEISRLKKQLDYIYEQIEFAKNTRDYQNELHST